MRTPELFQIVVPPTTPNLREAIEGILETTERPRWNKRMAAKQIIATVLHRFGVHHWIRMRVFDYASKRAILTPDWICGVKGCPEARVG
jgi:hypothetical protein